MALRALSSHEKEEVKQIVEREEALPQKYRLSLFQEAPEVELIWKGKELDVTNLVLPFQTVERLEEPRAEKQKTAELSAPRDVGRAQENWVNKLIWGDNKLVLSSAKNGPMRHQIERAGGLKLIYIDPPFDIGSDFSLNIEIGNGEVTKRPSVIEEIAYRDTWGNGADSYLSMLYERLFLMRELLSDDGSIFLHVGAKVSHLVRSVMEEVFGRNNFRNEIILPGRAVKNLQQQFDSIQRLQVRHDVLLWFSKKEDKRFTPHWIEKHDAGNEEGHWHHAWSTADRPTMRYDLLGHTPKTGQWVWKEERAVKAVKNYRRFLREAGGRTLMEYWRDTGKVMEYIRPDPKDGKPQYWREPAELRLADTVWSGVPIYSANYKYPTEKNEKFMEEVIRLGSKEGDLVADFFCGSGTTCAVAEKMGRKWLGCDLGRFAVHTSRKRLAGVQRELKAEGNPYGSFEILNLGKYERQYFVGINPGLPEDKRKKQTLQKEEQYVSLVLEAYKGVRVIQLAPFHGRRGNTVVFVGPIDAPVTIRNIQEVLKACKKNKISSVDVLGFEFEMGLIETVKDDAKSHGVNLSIKYIPKDVFDKRAIAKDQVKFFDAAYIDIKAKVKGKNVVITLANYSVFYTQDGTGSIAESVRAGGEKVAIEFGKVVRLSKDKSGKVSREVLTKKWTDWIDYWAIDFDYESRKDLSWTVDSKGKEVSEWNGSYIFENEWQSFRTAQNRSLELESAPHEYTSKGVRKIAVKVIDIFGNDTTKIIEVKI